MMNYLIKINIKEIKIKNVASCEATLITNKI